jgi:hypothetical protein
VSGFVAKKSSEREGVDEMTSLMTVLYVAISAVRVVPVMREKPDLWKGGEDQQAKAVLCSSGLGLRG